MIRAAALGLLLAVTAIPAIQAAQPAAPAQTEPDTAEPLATGWRWLAQPMPVQNLDQRSSDRVFSGGALLAFASGQTTEFRLVSTIDASQRNSARRDYQVHAWDEAGEPVEVRALGWSTASDTGLWRFSADIDPGRLSRIGVAILDFEGRKVRSRQAADRAEANGAAALPLPVEGEALAFELPTLDGSVISSEDLRGKVVLLDCWATWCGPCMKKMPELKQVREAFGDSELAIIGINFDADAQVARKAIAEHGLSWPQVHAPSAQSGYDGDLWHDMTGITSLPRLFLIDRDGVLRADFYPHDLAERIATLVRQDG